MTTSTPGLAELAGPLADTAMVNLVREFPYAPAYVLRGPDDLTLPRQRHPAFYGAYDWHSAVHMHWLLVRLLRRHPERVHTAAMRRLLSAHLTPDALTAEADELRADRPSSGRTAGPGCSRSPPSAAAGTVTRTPRPGRGPCGRRSTPSPSWSRTGCPAPRTRSAKAATPTAPSTSGWCSMPPTRCTCHGSPPPYGSGWCGATWATGTSRWVGAVRAGLPVAVASRGRSPAAGTARPGVWRLAEGLSAGPGSGTTAVTAVARRRAGPRRRAARAPRRPELLPGCCAAVDRRGPRG